MGKSFDYLESEEFKKFRLIQLDLIKCFHQICKENSIEYFCVFGTLLGIIRHGGYIPWDDDVDLAIWRKDVPRLCEAVDNCKYNIQTLDDTSDYFLGVMKFYNPDTTNISPDSFFADGKYGISIDIEVIDGCFADERKRSEKNERLELLYNAALFHKHGEHSEFMQNLDFKKMNCVRECAKAHSLAEIAQLIDMVSQENDGSKFCSIYTYNQFPVLKREWFAQSIDMYFEGIKLKVPYGWENFLVEIYGDNYLSLPPKENRLAKHTAYNFIDADMPFSRFVFGITSFTKLPLEKKLILWGSGNMAKHYIRNFGRYRMPDLIIDNAENKWNTELEGCMIKGPDALLDMNEDDIQILVCNIYYREIVQQIKKLGNYIYYIYWENYVDKHIDDFKMQVIM